MGEDYRDYEDKYDEKSFWSKVKEMPSTAGCEAVRKALTLWCVLTSDDTPVWAKVLITSALGYFVMPLDLIPDILPCGFLDDISAMALCLAEVEAFVTPEIEARVEENMPERWRRQPKE